MAHKDSGEASRITLPPKASLLRVPTRFVQKYTLRARLEPSGAHEAIEGSTGDAALKTVAYLRVSTRSQDLANQKLAILEFSQKRRFPIDQFIESRISSRQSPLERRIDEMLGTLEPGDRLLVSELSRLGRSLSQVIQIVETLVRKLRDSPPAFSTR